VGSPYARGIHVDAWGCRFDNLQDGLLGVVREPLIRNLNDLGALHPPDAALAINRDAVNGFCRASDKFVLAPVPVHPFERYCFLRTMEGALTDVFLQPHGFVELLARIHAHYLRVVEAWASTEVDAVFLMDDWGFDERMLISPETWRRVFKPLYRDYSEVARKAGKSVFMHSDGRIDAIIGDLVDVGVHALNCQVTCMGAAELGSRFRGKLTFWGEIDRHLLCGGTVDDVRNEVSSLRRHLWSEGGLIAQCEFGPGAKPENVIEVFRAFDADTARAQDVRPGR
jgi:hypothetical protein